MSETNNLNLFKHDNASTNTNPFDIEKALNENWDKIDEAIGASNEKIENQEIEIAKIERDQEELNKKVQEIETTEAIQGKDGKSAYEIAVENGYTGTEKEWLASLKGRDGKDGVDGKDGDKGDKGDAFVFSDFTEEQLASLKGEKGEKGEPFTFADFTTEQLASLKGEKGDKGDPRK